MGATRRRAIALFAAGSAAALSSRRTSAQDAPPLPLPLTKGPFTGSIESLSRYEIPLWFGQAKFGIWSHWGPQSGVEQGDWYARNMYMQGTRQNLYHVANYGPPSRVGYKDLIPSFKGARWDPDHLMGLYQKAGAQYFFTTAVHHDNFDMWNSKHQPRWNAVHTALRRDVVGEYAKAARKRGLRFGVSEHLSNSYDWLAVSHGSDATGDLAGVPYDGADPAFADLYHDLSEEPADFVKANWKNGMGRIAPESWKLQYYLRIKDLVDQHHPDMLYTDGGIPFSVYGLSTVAELYNVDARRNGGRVDGVYFTKAPGDLVAGGVGALDRERGVLDFINPAPWQTDTCIGNWHYLRGITYKTSKQVIDLMVDIVSKNGNLLLNFPLPNSGELDPEEMRTLDGITQWMAVNSEGIYATKPWTIFGEGPATERVATAGGNPKFNEGKNGPLGAQDIRYTSKGSTLYAFMMGWPGDEAVLPALGLTATTAAKVHAVSLLGGPPNLTFKQQADSLRVSLPEHLPRASDIGITFKIHTA
jgi:alpha-L-fucosidase